MEPLISGRVENENGCRNYFMINFYLQLDMCMFVVSYKRTIQDFCSVSTEDAHLVL